MRGDFRSIAVTLLATAWLGCGGPAPVATPLSCPGDQHACFGSCVANDSPEGCGTSCAPCEAPANASATCESAACGFSCHTGFHACWGQCWGDDSPLACGAACTVCPTPEPGGSMACVQGACVVTPPPASPDAGTGETPDGGTTTPDAGSTTTPDAGTGETPDAGSTTPDAGSTTTPDAGSSVPDAGSAIPDAGSTTTPDAGPTELTCGSSEHTCYGRCVSDALATSCGDSCLPCGAPANANALCESGSCGFACRTGFHACWGQCWADESPFACGTSCTVCPLPHPGATIACVAGQCVETFTEAPDAGSTTTPDAGSPIGPDAGSSFPDAGSVTPDAGSSPTPDAGVPELPDAGSIPTPDAGSLFVAVSPSEAQVSATTSTTFAASVSGAANTLVVWSVAEGPSCGSITQDGVYTAPASTAQKACTVRATSVENPLISGYARVLVVPKVTVTTTPASATVTVGETQVFTASVAGADDGTVVWNVREGASGGSLTQAGLYTAPRAAGTYHVVATSVADPRQTATAAVTVIPLVKVSVCPKVAALLPNEILPLTGLASGGSDTRVTWSASAGSIDSNGRFTAPSAPATITITATSTLDPRRTASATVKVVTATRPLITGTVTYAGSRQGRIYVQGLDYGVGTTSLPAPGKFSIRGISRNAGDMATISAWMDTLGTGRRVTSLSPSGSATVQLTTTGATVNITLTDPPATAPNAPSAVMAFGGRDHAIVMYGEAQDSSGELVFGQNKVYAATHPNPGPAATNAATRTVRAGHGAALFKGLPAGSYYFTATTLRDGVESPAATPFGPVTVGSPGTGTTVSGTVSFAGAPPAGDLYVVAVPPDENKGAPSIYLTSITNPAENQAFTIEGVPPGSWAIGALLDRDGDGELGPDDPNTFDQGASAGISVASQPITGVQLAMPTGRVNTLLATGRETDPNGNTSWRIEARVSGAMQLPLMATLVGGNGATVPQDLSLDRGTFSTSIFLGAAPAVGDSYALDVLADDGMVCDETGRVTSMFSAAPSGLSATSSGTPTLSWTLPAGLPSNTRVYLWVRDTTLASNGDIWSASSPTLTSSVVYNADGKGPALVSGRRYEWFVRLEDAQRNFAQAGSSFVAP